MMNKALAVFELVSEVAVVIAIAVGVGNPGRVMLVGDLVPLAMEK
jgi:hypothetical protein